MKDFKVSYEDKEGDLSHVRIQADNREGAKAQAKREYWDIDRIIQVIEL